MEVHGPWACSKGTALEAWKFQGSSHSNHEDHLETFKKTCHVNLTSWIFQSKVNDHLYFQAMPVCFPWGHHMRYPVKVKHFHVLEFLISCFHEFTTRTKSQYAVGSLPAAPLITRLIFTLFLIKKTYSPFKGTKTEQLFRKINIGRVVAPYRKLNCWQQICSKTNKSMKRSPVLQHDPLQAPQQ